MNDLSEVPFSRRQFLGAALATTVSVASTRVYAAEKTNRIGFVDDNLDNFHARTYLRILRAELKDRGFVVSGATALQAEKSRRWANEHDVPYFDTVERLNKVVDYFAVLAPATPQTHLGLCQQVLPLGKTTFVDKTFAPDTATAEKIFALADKHKVAMQSSSALRYTAIQKHVAEAGRDNLRHMISWGGGSNFDEYVIHPLELVISCMGHEAVELMRRGTEPQSQLLINFTRGRTAVVNVYNKSRTQYAATVTTDQGTDHIVVDTSGIFVDTAAAVLDFFDKGRPNIDRRESLSIMRIIDAAKDDDALERFVKL